MTIENELNGKPLGDKGRRSLGSLLIMLLFGTMLACNSGDEDTVETFQEDQQRWSKEAINEWYEQIPWPVGCNFIPSTAINQLEMWQNDTYDPKTIDRELAWAEAIGFNTIRVYLHDLAWRENSELFKENISDFLEIASSHHIKVMFVLFDDVWNDNPVAGAQPEPIPGVHNSGWVRSPGSEMVADQSRWQELENYLMDILVTYGQDDRILMWDLYNEAGNSQMESITLPLLKAVFSWARNAGPSQPITSGIWSYQKWAKSYNNFLLASVDVITFHNYRDFENMQDEISSLKSYGRPVICTEYMARTMGNLFQTHLPLLHEEDVGAINWGLVTGKTQTRFPWGSPEGAAEPALWFHDIFQEDGTPFDEEEIVFIKSITL